MNARTDAFLNGLLHGGGQGTSISGNSDTKNRRGAFLLTRIQPRMQSGERFWAVIHTRARGAEE